MPNPALANGQRESGYRDALRLEALGLMTAGIVHDLGNMIQILSSAIGILERDPRVRGAAVLQPAVTGAIGSLDSATAMVRQILAFVREEPASARPVDIALALAGMERLLRWLCGGIVVDLRLDPALPTLRCDRHKLENAILNLVLNARDAMPDGGVLTITASQCAAASGDLIISVADTGSGMSQDLASRAFEPLFTTKGDTRGTGLGLAMVRQFAQELCGNASIQTAKGVGTTVTLRIPTQRRPTPSTPPPQTRTGRNPSMATTPDDDVEEVEAWLDNALADSFPASDPLPPRPPAGGGAGLRE